MNKPVPNGKEANFDIEELFFSTSDSNGLIQHVNEVFQKISGYNWEHLKNAPHNIIRHPDMPRCVFKLFWDKLKSGKPISAYVKNMSADGGYYWVLASAFPVSGGYLSIRMKPTSNLFKAVEAIYAEVLAFENEKGMDEAYNYLLTRVVAAGFTTYESLMVKALTEEMKIRETHCTEKKSALSPESHSNNSSSLAVTLTKISDVLEDSAEEYLNVFSKIQEFESSKKLLEEKTSYLLDSFQDFELISLNMRVFAALLGDEGASLGVIATEFREIVGNIEKHFRTFETAVVQLSKMMNSAALEICFSKLQFDMAAFFIIESIKKIHKGTASVHLAFESIEQNSNLFVELFKNATAKIDTEMRGLRLEIKKFDVINKEIKKFVNGLEVIAQMGSVESARLNESEQSFNVYIKRMEEFNEILKASNSELVRVNRGLDNNQVFIASTIKHALAQFHEILKLTLAVKESTELEKSA